MFGLPLYSYLRDAAPSTQPRLKWPSIQNAQEKAKEKGEKERNEEKMGDQIAKKKKKKKKNLHAHTFSTVIPVP